MFNGIKILESYQYYPLAKLEYPNESCVRIFLSSLTYIELEDFSILKELGWEPPDDVRKFWWYDGDLEDDI